MDTRPFLPREELAIEESPLSLKKFIPFVVFLVVFVCFALRYFFPGVWREQLAAGFLMNVAFFVTWSFLNCFSEFFFHRYILHIVTVGFLQVLSMKHGTHHSLTQVRLKAPGGAAGIVVNRYPIVRLAQHKSATFPVYAPFAFLAAFSPLIVFLQWLFPRFPIALTGACALIFSYASYEVLHSSYHKPYQWWKKRIEHPTFGWFWRKVYGFHLGHHANEMCNEAVGGFFGLPAADWVFGTLKIPRVSLADNSIATTEDFAAPVPCRLIRWLDRRALAHEKRLMLEKRG